MVLEFELPPIHIAIIGGGPKGIYGFERLVAQCKAIRPTSTIIVHIFNRTKHFAAGEIYNPDQPDFLKMNVCRWAISMWQPDEVPQAVCTPLTFEQWEDSNSTNQITQKEKFPSRKLVGEYLIDGYERIKKEMPSCMILHEEVAEVIDMNRTEDGYKLIVKDQFYEENQLQDIFKYVLLTTGHPTPSPFAKERFIDTPLETNLIPFIYPIHPNLDTVAPESVIGIKGMGLTFTDAVLALTEGRGGKFDKDPEGNLTYHTSGLEPKLILPFSRNGLLMTPRTGKKNKDKSDILHTRAHF